MQNLTVNIYNCVKQLIFNSQKNSHKNIKLKTELFKEATVSKQGYPPNISIQFPC